MESQPLRYQISDWHQLSQVKSNNSRDLKIIVSDFVQDNRLTGLRIQIYHKDFGVLFACITGAQGSLITENSENLIVEVTPQQILAELEKYGFLISFEPREHLPGTQLEYLMTLKELGYEKIRVLNVWHLEQTVKVFKWYVVAFSIKENTNWLNNGYAASESEFINALKNGSALNISAVSKTKRWSWSWLDYVANIDDVLADNA